jgi:hypothetical protein
MFRGQIPRLRFAPLGMTWGGIPKAGVGIRGKNGYPHGAGWGWSKDMNRVEGVAFSGECVVDSCLRRNYESQASRWLVCSANIAFDEWDRSILLVNLTRRPDNEYFSNGLGKEQDSVL